MRFARGKSRSKAKRESSEEKQAAPIPKYSTQMVAMALKKTGHALLLIYLIYIGPIHSCMMLLKISAHIQHMTQQYFIRGKMLSGVTQQKQCAKGGWR